MKNSKEVEESGLARFITVLKTKQNTIVTAIGAVVALGQAFNLFELTDAQVTAVLGVVTAFYLLIGAQTVTSNVRLTGRALGGWSGVTPDAIADSDATGLVLGDASNDNDISG